MSWLEIGQCDILKPLKSALKYLFLSEVPTFDHPGLTSKLKMSGIKIACLFLEGVYDVKKEFMDF